MNEIMFLTLALTGIALGAVAIVGSGVLVIAVIIRYSEEENRRHDG